MSNSERILVVGPAWVGDMVMSSTLFQLLAKRAPCPQIDVLAPEWTHPLLARMPQVNLGISMPVNHGQLLLKRRYLLGKELRSKAYSQAIVLPNSLKSALIPFWAHIPKRTGWLGETRYILLNDHRRLDRDQYPLMIERFAALAFAPGTLLDKALPKPALETCDENLVSALNKLALNKSAEQPILALCPGAEYGPAKRWPSTHFAAIANHYLTQNWSVWIFGSHKDDEIAQAINAATQNQCQNLCGKTSLGDAVDLMSLAAKVLTNDSGLMHIAAALERPLVALYGSSSPGFTPPLGHQSLVTSLELDCSPCFKRVCPLGHLKCLVELTPASVIERLESLEHEVALCVS